MQGGYWYNGCQRANSTDFCTTISAFWLLITSSTHLNYISVSTDIFQSRPQQHLAAVRDEKSRDDREP
jgi:hypothetical protein